MRNLHKIIEIDVPNFDVLGNWSKLSLTSIL